MTITGRCLCGVVTYRCDSPPLFASICFCEDCRRWSGAGALPVLGVERADLRLEGAEPGCFESIGGSGSPTFRYFCAHCGSGLFGAPGAMPGLATIYCGTLDQPELFKPTMAVCTAGRPSWSPLALDCPEFERMPVL